MSKCHIVGNHMSWLLLNLIVNASRKAKNMVEFIKCVFHLQPQLIIKCMLINEEFLYLLA